MKKLRYVLMILFIVIISGCTSFNKNIITFSPLSDAEQQISSHLGVNGTMRFSIDNKTLKEKGIKGYKIKGLRYKDNKLFEETDVSEFKVSENLVEGQKDTLVSIGLDQPEIYVSFSSDGVIYAPLEFKSSFTYEIGAPILREKGLDNVTVNEPIILNAFVAVDKVNSRSYDESKLNIDDLNEISKNFIITTIEFY